MKRSFVTKAVLFLTLFFSTPALANVVVWTGAVDSDWFWFENWNTMELPDENSETRIPGPATVSVTESGAQSDFLSVGFSTEGLAVLSITDSGNLMLHNPGRIASTSNSPGRVEVFGAQAEFQSLGGSGLSVGQFDEGELDVNAGGTVSFGSLSIGTYESGQGTVYVRDANSLINIAELVQVGAAGSGRLEVTNSGIVVSGSGSVGSGATGTGEVFLRDAGTIWTVNGPMLIGHFGTGMLTLTDGATLSVNNEGDPGILHMGSQLAAEGSLRIGEGGAAGQLLASQIRAGQGVATVIFDHDESLLDFTVDGVPITLTQLDGTLSLQHVGPGTTRLSGNDNFTGNTVVTSGKLLINGLSGSPVWVSGDGVLAGNGLIDADVHITGGSLAPGDINLPSALKVSGDVTFEAGSTLRHRIDIFGDEQLEAGGVVTFDDTSIVVEVFESDFYFEGQRFTVVEASQIIGTPDILIDPNTLVEFDVFQASDTLELRVAGFKDEVFSDRFQME
jgi:T5SS/PEP-CTERM-associated repeat protein/autotransporter-associated beta strand protein